MRDPRDLSNLFRVPACLKEGVCSGYSSYNERNNLGATMIVRLSIALLACVFITGCGKKIVTTWVDGKKHGFEETFNNDGELILRECFQAGVKVEPSICNDDSSR